VATTGANAQAPLATGTAAAAAVLAAVTGGCGPADRPGAPECVPKSAQAPAPPMTMPAMKTVAWRDVTVKGMPTG
jgi:hypothetical protein